MSKVSVVIPNYNHAQFLDQRIQSVLDQTYQDFEVLYLDDASTDDSSTVFAKYAGDPRIRVFLNETNSGSPFKQWNKGVREARGEYVWIAESDDYADKNFLKRLVPLLDRNPEVGVAYCQSLIVDGAGDVISNCGNTVTHLDSSHWTKDYICQGKEECRQFLVHQNTIPNASAVVFRRELYGKVGGADETLRLCGDWMLWIKMLLVSDVAFCAQPLNFFRKHAASVTHISTRNGTYAEERYRVLSELKKSIEFSSEQIESVCNAVINLWLWTFLSKRPLSWKRNRDIYKLGVTVDPSLQRRIIQNIPLCMIQKINAAKLYYFAK